MINVEMCKILAEDLGYRWTGCSPDNVSDEHATGMFHMGYQPLVLPMALVRRYVVNILLLKRVFPS